MSRSGASRGLRWFSDRLYARNTEDLRPMATRLLLNYNSGLDPPLPLPYLFRK
jgi:hypothetical protein